MTFLRKLFIACNILAMGAIGVPLTVVALAAPFLISRAFYHDILLDRQPAAIWAADVIASGLIFVAVIAPLVCSWADAIMGPGERGRKHPLPHAAG